MSTMMSPAPWKHRITVDEYCRMVEIGLLAPDARVELIEGEIIDMAPPGISHEAVVDFRSPTDGKYVEEASTPTPGITPVPGLPGTTVDLSRVLSL